MPSDKVQEEIVNNEAYILFYQRRKIDSAECSGSNSSSSEHWLSKMTLPPNPTTSSTTICVDVKKDDIERVPDTSEKHETEAIVTHLNKEIQTDDCESEKKSANAVEATPPEECTVNVHQVSDASSSVVPVKVAATNEDEIVDVISLDAGKSCEIEPSTVVASSPVKTTEKDVEKIDEKPIDPIKIDEMEKKSTTIVSLENEIDIEVELRNMTVKKSEGALSMSFPTQRSLWPFENHHNTIHTYTPILSRGSLNFNELLSSERNAHLRHSLSTSLGQRSSTSADKSKLISVTANDKLAMVRGVSSCSKDTLIYIDQQNHHRSLMDDETNFMANQPLWVNFVCNQQISTSISFQLNGNVCDFFLLFRRFHRLHHIN